MTPTQKVASIQTQLEELLARETRSRACLTVALQSLADDVACAAHRIGTRYYADGVIGLDHRFEYVKECESNLCDILDEIRYANWALQDAQEELDEENIRPFPFHAGV